MLIRRRVREAIGADDLPFFRFPWSPGAEHSKSEDYDFCRRAREREFRVSVDPELSLAMGHIGTTVYKVARRGAEVVVTRTPVS